MEPLQTQYVTPKLADPNESQPLPLLQEEVLNLPSCGRRHKIKIAPIEHTADNLRGKKTRLKRIQCLPRLKKRDCSPFRSRILASRD
ncbi:MAG TPA: hypothetical protein VMH00_00370 [Candidatus Limnocylindrales bacterium]|nr:hypothetical protein [Candidatus Limnocylindrales bacterium]